jgi:two-component system CheB/CheR fusion protein
MNPPLCVLVVDDGPQTAETWCLLLSQWGHRPLAAYDAAAALAVARAEMPDVALLDIGLPGMGGWELARRLRAEPALAGTQLIAVTGRHTEADREKSAAAGIRWHLVKPVEPDFLRRLLGVCGPQRARLPRSLTAARPR